MARPRLVTDAGLLCIDCKTYKLADEFYKSNSVKNTYGLTYICKECSKEKQKTNRNTEVGFWRALWNNLNNNAKRRNLEIKITKEDLIELYKKQQGLCSVTNIPMQFTAGTQTNKNQFGVSVDRVDSTQGYEINNIRLVCSHVNIMKMNLTDQQLMFWCKAILQGKS